MEKLRSNNMETKMKEIKLSKREIIDEGLKKDLSIIDVSPYLSFRYQGRTDSEKTQIWNVNNLGVIKWKAGWRCYAFYPLPDSFYEEECLRDIAIFCELLTITHNYNRRIQ